jgi:hypothetical protein
MIQVLPSARHDVNNVSPPGRGRTDRVPQGVHRPATKVPKEIRLVGELPHPAVGTLPRGNLR